MEKAVRVMGLWQFDYDFNATRRRCITLYSAESLSEAPGANDEVMKEEKEINK